MAKSFFYPVSESISVADGSRTDTSNGSTLYSFNDGSSSNVTSEWHLTNNNIGHSSDGFGSNEIVRFDLGGNVGGGTTHVAVYHSGGTSSDIEIYYGVSNDNGTDMGDSTNMPITTSPTMSSTYNKGWNLRSFSSVSRRYWFIRSTQNFFNPNEVMLCRQYEFEIEPELSQKQNYTFGEQSNTSWNGKKYINKVHEQRRTWNWTWRSASATTKSSLEGIIDIVQDYKKFIYYDDSEYHYVRLMQEPTFTEIANNIFDIQIKLEEQLS
jgi:hypothetical protein